MFESRTMMMTATMMTMTMTKSWCWFYDDDVVVCYGKSVVLSLAERCPPLWFAKCKAGSRAASSLRSGVCSTAMLVPAVLRPLLGPKNGCEIQASSTTCPCLHHLFGVRKMNQRHSESHVWVDERMGLQNLELGRGGWIKDCQPIHIPTHPDIAA